jgi:predicted Fe-S protein YdhL (DUF1289 family)
MLLCDSLEFLMASAEPSIQSPCNRVCVMHPSRHICIGCGRSLDEITHWIELTEAERRAIMAQLPERLAAGNGVNAASPLA